MTDRYHNPDRNLDDTVADEEFIDDAAGNDDSAPPAEPDHGRPEVDDPSIALSEPDPDPVTPSSHDNNGIPRPPVPIFGHSAPADDEDVPLTRRLALDEPAPPPQAPARALPDPYERASDRRWRPDLSDTPGLQEDRHRYPPAQEAEDDLDDIFDRPERLVTGSTAEYDPEAGRTNVAVKIQAVREVVRSATSTPFGRLMVSLPIALAGITLSIMAAMHHETWMIIAAAIVMPTGAFLVYRRYQAWLGHKRYMYRLLESLGEDVSDFDPARANRRIGKVIQRK